MTPQRESTDLPLSAPAPAGVFLSLYAPTEKHLDFLAEILRQGDLVAVPSETVYGLAAKATDAAACAKIFALKRRPTFDPLIVHVLDLTRAEQYACFNPLARALAERFWPGPLTLVVPKKSPIPGIVTSNLPTLALRSPAHPVFRALLERLDFGLAAPSANPFGYISPTTAEHVADSFGSSLPYILDGGPCPVGLESTIVDCSRADQSEWRILRQGAIDESELRECIAHLLDEQYDLRGGDPDPDREDKETPLAAPGMLSRHYSPRKPLRLVNCGDLPDPDEEPRIAFLAARERLPAGCPPNLFSYLSSDSAEAPGRHLYTMLRQLDRGDWEWIVAELPPTDLRHAAAIRDRLTRAAATS